MPHLTSIPSLHSSASTRSDSSTSGSCDSSAMSDDGFKAFSYLHQSAPAWLADISKLEQSIEDKQKEMDRLPERPPHLVRNGSVTSVREDVISEGIDSSAASPQRGSTPHSSSRRPNLLVKRRKSPGSVASTMASGFPKFRTRSMVIVYYDAEIQKAFEKLVREISVGRNLIRKGKMAARMEALTNNLDNTHIYKLADGEMLPFAIPHFRRAGERPPAAAVIDARSGKTPTAYDRVDNALEKAQRLCEQAAHQFLRDGDCRLETRGTKEAFQEVQNITLEELPRLLALEQTRSQRTKTAPPRLEAEQPATERPNTELTLGSIEVDDAEDEAALSMPELYMIPRRAQRRSPPAA